MPQFFITRPIFAWVIALSILLAGSLALTKLPVSQYPEVAPPALTITATYPGAGAQQVEDTVINLIESEMNGLEHLLYMESSSEATGEGTITLTFATGTNLDVANMETQNRIKRVEARLPDEVKRMGITVAKSRRNFLMFLLLTSPDNSMNSVDLGNFASTRVIDSIRRVQGVGEALLFGTDYSMRIWLDPLKLASYSLTPGDALQAVKAQNVQVSTGELGQLPAAAGQELNATILVKGRVNTPEAFGNIILRTNSNGSNVYLKDVARIELGAQEYLRNVKLNGVPAVGIGIKLAPGDNALATVQRVRERMSQLSQSFPSQSVSWDIPYDTSRFVDISIREVIKTLLEAFVLVFLVMWLFMGNLRAAVIPTIVVPVSLTGAMLGLYAMGYSINVLTLFAMILAIGILVDDAIVVVENVERIMTEEGLDAKTATRKAMKQIFSAIIGITLVLIAVFLPMAFFSGSVGAIYRQFSVTLVVTIAFSAFLALSLTPALTTTLLRQSDMAHHTGFLGWFNDKFASFTTSYSRWVSGVLSRPVRFGLIYVAIVTITAFMYSKLPTGFLPEEDQGYLINLIQLPPNATQERTLAVLQQVDAYYRAQPEVNKVIAVAGFSFLGKGQDAALVFVSLKDWSQRLTPGSDAASLARKANMTFFKIKQAMIFAINPPPIPELAAVGGFDFRLMDIGAVGRDKLLEARNMVLGMAAQNKTLAGVRPESKEFASQLLFNMDRTKAQALGIDLADLNNTLQVGLGSAYVNDFIRDGRVLRVQMRVDAPNLVTPDDILALRVRNKQGDTIALSEIATPEWVVGAPKLDRYNGVPSMKIAGAPAPGSTTGEAMQVMQQIGAQLPAGIGFDWSGTSYEERLSASQAGLLFTLSILVVFLCLAALYESWSVPLAILLVVPLGLFGEILAVIIRDLPNDIYFKVGMVVIIGLAAKNAILIVEFARHLELEGKSLIESIVEASRLRLRPIIMTSIAFVFGVLPLAFATGAGAASRHAIGTGVMGGMLSATFLAIFFVPLLYLLIRRIFPGGKPIDHAAEEMNHV
ncbi:MAG: multidrug efflux RND transporter permease subunit [Thiotrichales bacterium]|nr:multidrug efflux RND transporter permease subunit [Thiotrichales bacterium]